MHQKLFMRTFPCCASPNLGPTVRRWFCLSPDFRNSSLLTLSACFASILSGPSRPIWDEHPHLIRYLRALAPRVLRGRNVWDVCDMERTKGVEPSTSTLEGLHSTN